MATTGRKPDGIAARHKIISARIESFVHDTATEQAESRGIELSAWLRAAIEEKLDRDVPGWASMDGTLKLASYEQDRLLGNARRRDRVFRKPKDDGSPDDT